MPKIGIFFWFLVPFDIRLVFVSGESCKIKLYKPIFHINYFKLVNRPQWDTHEEERQLCCLRSGTGWGRHCHCLHRRSCSRRPLTWRPTWCRNVAGPWARRAHAAAPAIPSRPLWPAACENCYISRWVYHAQNFQVVRTGIDWNLSGTPSGIQRLVRCIL